MRKSLNPPQSVAEVIFESGNSRKEDINQTDSAHERGVPVFNLFSAVMETAHSLQRSNRKSERLQLQDAVRSIMPKHRTAACHRHRLGRSAVTVSVTEHGTTRLGGLMVCSAHHICPCCHHRKMAHDRGTATDIVREHYASAGFMVDTTFTVAHNKNESLATVLARLESTWDALRSKPIWRELEAELGIVGCIRRLEITLGLNGWHPHYHVSFLCDWALAKGVKGHHHRAALDSVFAHVATAWSHAGQRVGSTVDLLAQAAVGIIANVDAERAICYNTKNMGYGPKSGNLTPMDLLRVVHQSESEAAVSSGGH